MFATAQKPKPLKKFLIRFVLNCQKALSDLPTLRILTFSFDFAKKKVGITCLTHLTGLTRLSRHTCIACLTCHTCLICLTCLTHLNCLTCLSRHTCIAYLTCLSGSL
jgi:hypothetical protein